jgi:hypothetical protein
MDVAKRQSGAIVPEYLRRLRQAVVADHAKYPAPMCSLEMACECAQGTQEHLDAERLRGVLDGAAARKACWQKL